VIFTSKAISEAIQRQRDHLIEGEHSLVTDKPRIVIEPFNEAQLNPNSYNLRLHPEMKVYNLRPTVQRFPTASVEEKTIDWRSAVENWDGERHCIGFNGEMIELAAWAGVLDLRESHPTYAITIPETGVVLVPGRLYIARTVEYTESHNCIPGIEGRSSFGRLGLNIHSTAGYGDIGFCGTWTLEITVAHPTRIYPNVEICQLQFTLPHGDIGKVYRGKYIGQVEATPSLIHRECGQVREGAVQ